MDFVSLIDSNTSVKVSSTLEKSTGKKNLVDNSPETCWTSQQGLPQFVLLGFRNLIIPRRLSLTFQGGFVGTQCGIYIQLGEDSKDWSLVSTIYPEDVNRRQIFDIVPGESNLLYSGISALKLVFENSSDFFGRITLYEINLEGTIL